MGVYRMKVAGREKAVLVRADSLAKAEKAIVSGEQLKAEDMEKALLAGDKVWTPGEPFPDDEQTPPPAVADESGAEPGK